MSAGTKYHYEVNGGGRHEYASRTTNLRWLAQECAEDYHGQHDGWEARWPVDMVIYTFTDDEDGPAIWTGTVDREDVPSFFASEAK